MMKRLRLLIAGLAIIPSLSFVTTLALPSVAHAATCPTPATFLTFPAWYKGLQGGGSDGCAFQPKTYTSGADAGKADPQATAVVIALNVVNILLQLVGYASVVFLIIGGFKYMTSQGESSEIVGAKKTIMNAIIGLVVSILSVAIVNLVSGAV